MEQPQGQQQSGPHRIVGLHAERAREAPPIAPRQMGGALCVLNAVELADAVKPVRHGSLGERGGLWKPRVPRPDSALSLGDVKCRTRREEVGNELQNQVMQLTAPLVAIDAVGDAAELTQKP
eukprot:scaffold15305_cov116-Isochrysis_galbana.AAC.2